MIVEWLMGVAVGFVQWLAGLFPVLELPDELVHLDDSFNSIFALGEGLGAFIPWGLVGLIAGIPLAVWVGGLLIKVVRVLVSHLPFIGGK